MSGKVSVSSPHITAWAPKSATVTGDLSFFVIDSADTRADWTLMHSLDAFATAWTAALSSVS